MTTTDGLVMTQDTEGNYEVGLPIFNQYFNSCSGINKPFDLIFFSGKVKTSTILPPVIHLSTAGMTHSSV